MSGSEGPNGTGASPASNYEWRYEYYDEEEPVSFEGLKAHRYSIVIGFWVGLAVFVICMFFLLTLLIKTGAPHPNEQPCEKRLHLTGYMDTSFNNGPPPAQPSGPDSSCSPFRCYVSREGQVSSRALRTSAGGGGGGASGGCHRRPSSSLEVGGSALLQELAVTPDRTGKEAIPLARFNIPNCVNSEQSSTVGEDNLPLPKPNGHSDFT
ncbi:melanocortin-2 receptor accessory protein 2A isoform X2 [Xiphias gladius]|uniref:melanocortin-2 receptor accessory protein 2A isoform X2 n=1 Tax=Xiphias gladius TaxID=8245 RepID=UPI001A98FB43|nr:melanocortin-2 receptor accessory protein 2A isoform X2 [Xiphias gladius]